MSYLFVEIIFWKHDFRRNLRSPVKNCLKVSLIYLSESISRGLILIDCDIYWGLVLWDPEDSEKWMDTEESGI